MKRSYEDFRVLDKHLHLCIYDRRYSELSELPRLDTLKDAAEVGRAGIRKQAWHPALEPQLDSALVFQPVTKMLSTYLSRFSAIADNKINCGPVLTWMEVSGPPKPRDFPTSNLRKAKKKNQMFSHQIDNKGNHLLVSEEASINVPAIAAAHVTKRYTAQATDELTFEVTRAWETRLFASRFLRR